MTDAAAYSILLGAATACFTVGFVFGAIVGWFLRRQIERKK